MYFLHSSVKKKSSYGCCMESEKQQGLKYCIAFMLIPYSIYLLLTPIIPAAVVVKKNFHTGCSFIMNVKEIVTMVLKIGGLADRCNLFF